MALSNQTKQNIVEILDVAKTTFRYACIPVILYLGKLSALATPLHWTCLHPIAMPLTGLTTGPEPHPSVLRLVLYVARVVDADITTPVP